MVGKEAFMDEAVLDIKKVNEISPHEEHISRHAIDLTKDILKRGILLYPIIVERDKNMILDGTHRYIAFRKLGIKYIPAISLPYNSGLIEVDRWVRHLDGVDINRFIKEEQIEFYTPKYEYDPRKEYGVYLVTGKGIYRVRVEDKMEISKVVRRFEDKCRGRIVRYLDRIDGEGIFIDYTPPSKDDVIKSFLRGELFPPKYTRHILNIPRIRIDIPIRKLNSYSEAYSYLNRLNYIFRR